MRFLLWILVLAVLSRAGAAVTADGNIAQRIQRGESFLTNLFDARFYCSSCQNIRAAAPIGFSMTTILLPICSAGRGRT